MTPEGIVVAAVERYFSQPKFQKFFVKKEHIVQMGAVNRRADVVLVDNRGYLAAITECKRSGVERNGIDQLKSYLSATATPCGIFANSTEPDSWNFYENLGRNRFREMVRSEFEEKVAKSENNLSENNPVQSHQNVVRSALTMSPKNKGGKGSMKIRPTLYIGLGTTGTEILNYLRIFRHQEFGMTEYPIFRYVSIETDTSTDGLVTEGQIDGPRNYIHYNENKIPSVYSSSLRPESAANKVIHTAIPAAEPIREAINPRHSAYNEHLATWLDPKILDIDATTRAGGAGNLRMVGRLSLWENWDKQSRVQRNLREAYDAIWEVDNRKKSAENLKRHFADSEVTVDEKDRNVFIVGTLCGGTCSGMLLDIAYYFRHIGNENTKIYGIFTMYDEALALEAPGIQLANCYASLVELDYYKRDATEYRVKLPNGPAIHTNQSPFDIATFLSATNIVGERFINQSGQFVQEDLDQTVAFDLFLRSLGVDSVIDADLVNSPGFDGRFEDIRSSNQFVQYMFGSGLEKVWLPKNRTVKTAATKFIEKLRSKWEGNNQTTSSDPATLFGAILADIRTNLFTTQSGSFENQLKAETANINTPTDASDLLSTLTAEGKYYKRFDGRRKDCMNQVLETLRGASQDVLDEISELIRSELKEDIYRNRLESANEIEGRVKQAEQSSQISTGGFLGFGTNKELSDEQFRNSIYAHLNQVGERLKNFVVKRVLSDLLSEIQQLIDSSDHEKSTIETKFTEAINFFHIDETISDEILKAADRLSQEYLGGLNTKTSVDELINLLRLSRPNCFHWHICNELRKVFNRISEDLMPEFNQDAVRRSGPYGEFTHSYMRNYRLRLERPGGETKLFHYLLANRELENTASLQSESQSRIETFPLSHLRVLYQMEAGFTVDDLRVVNRLKEEYDFYQETYSYPIHIDKDTSKFNPDAIRATIEANDRIKEKQERVEEMQKDWTSLRQLLPLIRNDEPARFQNVTFNGNGRTNGAAPLPTGVLEVKVLGDAGFPITCSDNEKGWGKLGDRPVAYNNFISETRSEFRNMLDEGKLQDYIAQLLEMDNSEDSEQFYEEYISLLKQIEPHQS